MLLGFFVGLCKYVLLNDIYVGEVVGPYRKIIARYTEIVFFGIPCSENLDPVVELACIYSGTAFCEAALCEGEKFNPFARFSIDDCGRIFARKSIFSADRNI